MKQFGMGISMVVLKPKDEFFVGKVKIIFDSVCRKSNFVGVSGFIAWNTHAYLFSRGM